MKLKLLFCLLSLCCSFAVSTVKASSNAVANMGQQVTLTGGYGVPFEIPRGSRGGSRSLAPSIPISVYVEHNQVELDFMEAIGDIEIVISRPNGTSVYSSSETISTPLSKVIRLKRSSGKFLLEIKGANGAYAYAWFTL